MQCFFSVTKIIVDYNAVDLFKTTVINELRATLKQAVATSSSV